VWLDLPSEAADRGGRDRAAARGRWRYLPRLWRLLWELGRREVLFLSVFSAACGLVPLLVLWALRHLIDSAVAAAQGTGPARDAALWLLALLAANSLQSFVLLAGQWLGQDTQERLKARVEARLLVKASRLPLAAFERPAFHDQLLRAQKGLETRLFGTMENLFPVPARLVTAAGMLVYVGTAGLVFPLILLAGFVPLHLAGLHFARRHYELEHRQTGAERVLRYMGELMTGREAAAEIRLLGLGSHLLGTRMALFRRLRDERLRLARAQAATTLGTTFAEQLTYAGVTFGVTAMIARGILSVGHFVSLLAAAERFRDSFGMLLYSARAVGDDLRYISDLLDYLDSEEEEATAPVSEADAGAAAARPLPPAAGECPVAARPPLVRFESVCFTYPGAERPALVDVELRIGPGERVAVVGENGAGKSTLAKLLLGLYSPTSGRVTADGLDLRAAAGGSWWGRVGAVFQEFVRYELTVRENIGFGELHLLHDNAAIRAAAAKSGADRIAESLPAGYETPLGKSFDEGGHELSTGQWQTLALARAHMRAASVLVLDEPTAGLDARAEAEVYRRFHEMSRGKTVLLISHRLGSARLADRVLLLEAGRVVEEGTHDQLMRLGGCYARMYTAQARWYQYGAAPAG
jgi:ATP-binding cassette, subfamily B, bacterial